MLNPIRRDGLNKSKYQKFKSKTRNSNFKSIRMTKNQNSKRYDLEDRTLEFVLVSPLVGEIKRGM